MQAYHLVCACRGARTTCYRLLGAEIVTEYVRSDYCPEQLEITVVAASGNCESLVEARELSVEARLNILCTSVDMYDCDSIQQTVMQLPTSLRLGYVTLRYLLSAERGVGLQLTELDCLAGMLVTLNQEIDQSQQTRATTRPQFRQLELQAWFQYTFKSIRALSQLLQLQECIPMTQPQHIFSGSTLLYMYSCHREAWYSLLSDSAKQSHQDIMASLAHLVVAVCPAPLAQPNLLPEVPAPAQAEAPSAVGVLPIEENKQMIIDHVQNHRVTIISGETGDSAACLCVHRQSRQWYLRPVYSLLLSTLKSFESCQ